MIEHSGVLILTVRIDTKAQSFFDALRQSHFPAERNFLKAHLTLFHQLADTGETVQRIAEIQLPAFNMQVTGLRNLGAGVAYRVEAEALNTLRATLSAQFNTRLTAQDKQGFRGHVTVQNKTSPEEARKLLAALEHDFVPFEVAAVGLDLWEYLGGPWRHKQYFPLSTGGSQNIYQVLSV